MAAGADALQSLYDGVSLVLVDENRAVLVDDLSLFQDAAVPSLVTFFNEAGPGLAYDTFQYNWQDGIVVATVVSKSVADTLNFYDDFSRFVSHFLSHTDSLDISDVSQHFNAILPIAADTLDLSDGGVLSTIAASLGRTVADTLALSDADSRLLSTAFLAYIRRYLNDVP